MKTLKEGSCICFGNSRLKRTHFIHDRIISQEGSISDSCCLQNKRLTWYLARWEGLQDWIGYGILGSVWSVELDYSSLPPNPQIPAISWHFSLSVPLILQSQYVPIRIHHLLQTLSNLCYFSHFYWGHRTSTLSSGLWWSITLSSPLYLFVQVVPFLLYLTFHFYFHPACSGRLSLL